MSRKFWVFFILFQIWHIVYGHDLLPAFSMHREIQQMTMLDCHSYVRQDSIYYHQRVDGINEGIGYFASGDPMYYTTYFHTVDPESYTKENACRRYPVFQTIEYHQLKTYVESHLKKHSR